MDVADQTGKAAVQTGKAIGKQSNVTKTCDVVHMFMFLPGGALTSAKSAVSTTVGGWFSSIRKWSSSESRLKSSSSSNEQLSNAAAAAVTPPSDDVSPPPPVVHVTSPQSMTSSGEGSTKWFDK